MQRRFSSDKGFTSIEVLVAAMVLSIVLLGVAAIYIAGVRNIGSGGFRSTAAFYLHQKLEQLRNTTAFPPAPVAPAAPESDTPLPWLTRTWVVSSFTGTTPTRLARVTVTVSWTDAIGLKTEKAVTYLPEP